MQKADEIRQIVEGVLRERRKQTLKVLLLATLVFLVFLLGLILILKPELVIVIVRAISDLFTKIQECKSGCPNG